MKSTPLEDLPQQLSTDAPDAVTDDLKFRMDMVNSVTRLDADVTRIKASVANLKLTLMTHEKLLRNHCNSMMSATEIKADFILNNRGPCYNKGGDCGLAAAESWVFFDTTHKLMCPKMVDGVLYACSGGKLTMGEDQKAPDAVGGVTPIMKRFVLEAKDGCIWVPAADELSHGLMNVRGATHRVTCVTTLEGKRLVVDWGIGQFNNMPDDIGLFLKEDDIV